MSAVVEAREKALQLFLVDREVQVLKGAFVIDALIAAVRAEERARCASAIRYRMNMLANALPYDAGAVNVALSDMLEALTGGPHE